MKKETFWDVKGLFLFWREVFRAATRILHREIKRSSTHSHIFRLNKRRELPRKGNSFWYCSYYYSRDDCLLWIWHFLLYMYFPLLYSRCVYRDIFTFPHTGWKHLGRQTSLDFSANSRSYYYPLSALLEVSRTGILGTVPCYKHTRWRLVNGAHKTQHAPEIKILTVRRKIERKK